MAALDAAAAAQADWAATPPRERGEILRRAFELLTGARRRLRAADDAGDGQAARRGPGEVTYGAEFFRWFSEEAVRIDGRYSVAPNGASPAARP